MNKLVRERLMIEENSISPDDSRGFRNALGQFATGVTVVSTQSDEGPVGMTANSFSSVSLDPPLVLWSIDKTSERHEIFSTAKRFAFSVLAEGQADIALAFARNATCFDAANCETPRDLALIKGALAHFECDLHTTVSGGDHTIVLGRVTNVVLGKGAPLVFQGGSFGSLTKG